MNVIPYLVHLVAEVNCVHSHWSVWLETATLCDPDTLRLAFWRQQPSCHQLGQQAYKCSFWVVKPVTLNRAQWRNRTFASGNMRFASCSALWSIFWRHGNATKIEITWEKSVEVGQNINWNENSKNCCISVVFYFDKEKKAMIYNQWSTYEVIWILLWWTLKLDKCYI